MNEQGYVYFIGSPLFGWYKIGKSKTPEVRVKDLGILLPFKIHIIGVWFTNNRHDAEKALHEIHKEKRINGEWFEFTKQEAWEFYESLPKTHKIYPSSTVISTFDNFSNVFEDTKNTSKGERRVLGLKVQKLRGNFTPEERDQRRIASMYIKAGKQAEKKFTELDKVPIESLPIKTISELLSKL
jgi:hypothetical protein